MPLTSMIRLFSPTAGRPEDAQLAQCETDQPSDVTPDDLSEDGYLYRDELVATFLSVAVSQIQSISPERAAALGLR